MDIKELLNVFASEREQLESMKYPEGWYLADEKTRRSIQLARTEQRELIMSKTRRDAFLLLSTLKKEQLIVWAAHFCSVFYMHKYQTKNLIKVEERLRNIRVEQRAVIKRYGEEIMLLRKEAKKIKDDRRKGADILHAENRGMKADVFTWLDSQAKFKSIEAAAMAITKQQPIAHVTGRDWYKEWKKIRSASTP